MDSAQSEELSMEFWTYRDFLVSFVKGDKIRTNWNIAQDTLQLSDKNRYTSSWVEPGGTVQMWSFISIAS